MDSLAYAEYSWERWHSGLSIVVVLYLYIHHVAQWSLV